MFNLSLAYSQLRVIQGSITVESVGGNENVAMINLPLKKNIAVEDLLTT
jgi:hypothetical protein